MRWAVRLCLYIGRYRNNHEVGNNIGACVCMHITLVPRNPECRWEESLSFRRERGLISEPEFEWGCLAVGRECGVAWGSSVLKEIMKKDTDPP